MRQAALRAGCCGSCSQVLRFHFEISPVGDWCTVPQRRSAANRSLVWLRDTITPLFVVNAQQRVSLFNQGCERLSGWLAGDILGKPAKVASVGDGTSLEALLSALAPPPDVWQGAPVQASCLWPHRDGTAVPRVIQFWPIQMSEAPVHSVLGIVGTPQGPSPEFPPLPEAHTWRAELQQVRHDLSRQFDERQLVGRSPAMLRVLEQLRLARLSSTPVLLTGEPGTGKERMARTLHAASRFPQRAWIALDGRLTPAVEWKRVLKQCQSGDAANDLSEELRPGTLYLSHLDAIPADVQERLLDLLIASLASPTVRVIAATTRPLKPLIESHQFSSELSLRLTPLVLELPPLCNRGDDLELLAQAFLEEQNRGSDKQVSGWDAETGRMLRRYQWPGNLDELKRVMQESHAAAGEGTLHAADLPFHFRAGMEAQQLGPRLRTTRPLDAWLEQVERDELEHAVQEAGGNLTVAAELLQIPRARLYRRLEQLGLRTAPPPASRLDSPEEAGES